jgi:chromosome segregation ATPase
MSNELTTVIVSLISAIFGSVISYFSTSKKNSAEIEKLKADAEKSRTETRKMKLEMEGKESNLLRQQAKHTDLDIQPYEREIKKLQEENLSLKSRIEDLTQENLGLKNRKEYQDDAVPPNYEF